MNQRGDLSRRSLGEGAIPECITTAVSSAGPRNQNEASRLVVPLNAAKIARPHKAQRRTAAVVLI